MDTFKFDKYKFRHEMTTPANNYLCEKHESCRSYQVCSGLDKKLGTDYTLRFCTKFRCPASKFEDYLVELKKSYELNGNSKNENGNGNKRNCI
jgi:hypothetical protein